MKVLMTLGPRKYAGCASRSGIVRGIFVNSGVGADDPEVPERESGGTVVDADAISLYSSEIGRQ